MALLGFAIPFLGIGVLPSVIVVVLYSLLPIVKNTFTRHTGFPELMESAKGIGLTKPEILFKVQIPLALPVMMAGNPHLCGDRGRLDDDGGLYRWRRPGLPGVLRHQHGQQCSNPCWSHPGLSAGAAEWIFYSVKWKNLSPRSTSATQTAKSAAPIKRFSGSLWGPVGRPARIFGIRSMVGTPTGDTIVVGGKNYTEQRLLCELASQAIEAKTDLTVQRKSNLGGTQVCSTL